MQRKLNSNQIRKLFPGNFRGKQMYIEQDFSKCQKKESNSLRVWTSNNHLHPFRFFSKIWGTLHVTNFK